MKKQLQLSTCTICMVLMGLTGHGQEFTVDGITDEVIPDTETVAIRSNTNTDLGDLIIPETVTNGSTGFSVTVIWTNAFENSGLTSVTIPESVTGGGSIGANAFTGNPDLATVVAKAIVPPSLAPDAFDNRGEIDLIVPVGATNAYQNPFAINGWRDFGSITEEENDVTDPDDFDFDQATGTITGYIGTATIVNIPETINGLTVTPIGEGAFQSKGLTSVTLPNSLIQIEADAFRDSALTGHLEIPDGVESIGYFAFADNRLEDIAIPESVTGIGESAFSGNLLESVAIPNSVTRIGEDARGLLCMCHRLQRTGARPRGKNDLCELLIVGVNTGFTEYGYGNQGNRLLGLRPNYPLFYPIFEHAQHIFT